MLHYTILPYIIFREKLPNFVIGFDLVGQEDLGKPILEFKELIEPLSKQTQFFFHAGETSKG